MNSIYTVVVGNIGTAHSGTNRKQAESHFCEYRDQSRRNYGRAAGESVVLLRNGDPIWQFVGKIDKEVIAECF